MMTSERPDFPYKPDNKQPLTFGGVTISFLDFNSQYQDEPMLEYIKDVAEGKYISATPFEYYENGVQKIGLKNPRCSLLPTKYGRRYHNGDIDNSSWEAFSSDAKLVELIKSFDFEPSKMWHYCLWLKDYILEECEGEISQNSATQDLRAIAEKLKEMEFEGDSYHITTQKSGSLKIRIGNGQSVEFTNPITLAGLIAAIEAYLPKVDEMCVLNSVPGVEQISLPQSYKIYRFRELMEYFFSCRKKVKGRNEIISRCAYHIGLTLDKNYLEKPTHIHNQLKNYQPPTKVGRHIIYHT